MYIINCRQCRTRLSDDARICSVCGHVINRVRSLPTTERFDHRPVVEVGTSDWPR